jgi:pyruvate dehydrogenase E1 component alpha subunit
LSLSQVEAIEAEAQKEITSALSVAEAAPWPVAADAYEDIMNTSAGVWV